MERDSPARAVILLAYATLACWALLEVGLRVREAVQGKGGRNRDRGTRILIAISLASAIGVASVLAVTRGASRSTGVRSA
jgi:hypothetical protein